jgi:cell division protease FtsH
MSEIIALKTEVAGDIPTEYTMPTATQEPRNVTDDQLYQERDDLFNNGSLFRPTYRNEIVGIDNVLDEIDDLIHYLLHSADYLRYDARPEPGAIFEGDPGTGKTSVARYIATASEALFVNVRDWPHKGSLFTDSDIRALFTMARAHYAETKRPIVLFMDEFEGVACERSGATPEQAAAVSQLTAELDGIHGKNEGILLVGCTNYIYGIDHALKRSGRMGLQIEFHAPDRKGKRLILEHYLESINVEGNVDTETLSYFFDPDATAADIEESCMEAWRFAVRRSIKLNEGTDDDIATPYLLEADLIQVFLKRLVGPPTTFIELDDDARFRIAIHESGHALAALVYGIPLRLITVQPGKKSLGRCMTAEMEDHIATVKEMEDHILVSLGSICAEEVAGIPAMLGSAGDIEGANSLAAKLVDRMETGKHTALFNVTAVSSTRGTMQKPCMPSTSEKAIEGSDEDVFAILKQTRARALAVMERIGKKHIRKIARSLNDEVTMTGAQFAELVREVTGVEDLRSFEA